MSATRLEDLPEKPREVPVEPEPYSVLRVERRGIQTIPVEQQANKPRDLFGLWAGGLWNISMVASGALVVALGLDFLQALIVIALGNLSFVLAGLASLQGRRARTAAMTISRAAFGPRGNKFLAGFNWLTVIGFEVYVLSLSVLAAATLARLGGISAGHGIEIVFLLALAALQFLLPWLGHAAITRVLRWLAVPFVAIFAGLAIIALPKVSLAANIHHSHPAGLVGLSVALALVISVTGLGWTNQANDFSRYLDPKVSSWRATAAVAFGGGIPSFLLMVLGAALATKFPSATNPITGLVHVVPGWFLALFLAVGLAQLMCVNALDLYSSGLTLQALGIRLARSKAVVLDTIIAGSLTAAVVLSATFDKALSDFLLFIIVWLAPWCAIFLVDWLLRQRRYDHEALLSENEGRYWYTRGFHLPALASQGVGMVASALCIHTSIFEGPVSRAVGGIDLSIPAGMIVGGGLYWLLVKGKTRSLHLAAPTNGR
jgi:purine-cytosine permease-like protein